MWTLFEIAWKSLALSGGVLVILHLLKSRSAAKRSVVAHAGLLAALLIPVCTLSGLALEVVIPVSEQARGIGPTAPTVGSSALGWLDVTPEQGPNDRGGPEEARPQSRALLAYLGTGLGFLIMPLLGVGRLYMLRARADIVVDDAWLSALARAQRRMGVRRGTALLVSGAIRSPVSWGFLQPIILLNERLLGDRTKAEAVIAHELAHVRRLDWAKLILSRLTIAALWFNPLVWLLARECHQLREEAADDAVLDAGVVAVDYADLLIHSARSDDRSLLVVANGVAAEKGSLRRRITRVLSSEASRSPASRRWIGGWSLGAALVAAAIGTLTFSPLATAASAARRPPPFDTIEIRGAGLVNIRHGEAAVRLVRGNAEQTSIAIEGGRLLIEACQSKCTDYEVEIEVTVDIINQAIVGSGGVVQSHGRFPRQEALRAAVSDGGLIRLISLRPDRMTAEIINGGTIKATVRDTLEASIQGDGAVAYWGTPAITTSISGSGIVVKADE